MVVDPAAANVLDSPGEFAWGGVASTYFWVDPQKKMFVIVLVQAPKRLRAVRVMARRLVYGAVVK